MKTSTNGYSIIETTEELQAYTILGSKAGDKTRFAFMSMESAEKWMLAEISDGNANNEGWFRFEEIDGETKPTGLVVTNE